MEQQSRAFDYRRTATTGCELVNEDGDIFAWTVNEVWAAIIVRVLNERNEECQERIVKHEGSAS